MKKLHWLTMRLVCVLLGAFGVGTAYGVDFSEVITSGHGFVRFVTDRENDYVIEEDENNKLRLKPYENGNSRQMWKVIKNGDYYLFLNRATGRYIDRGTGAATSLPTNKETRNYRVLETAASTTEKPLFYFRHENATETGWYYDGTSDYLQLKTTGDGLGWGFSPVVAEDVQFTIPTTGKYYRIYNGYWSSYNGKTDEVIEETNDKKLKTATVSNTNMAQLWELTSTDGTNFSFKNLSTGNYIQSQTGNTTQYTTGETETAFSVSVSANLTPIQPDLWYNFIDSDNDGLKMENHKVVNNILTNEVTQSNWRFENVSEEKVREIQAQNQLATILATNNGLVRITTDRSNGYVIADGGKDDAYHMRMQALDADNLNQVWIMQTSSSNYTLRNAGTGRYMNIAKDITGSLISTSGSSVGIAVNGDLSSTEVQPLFNLLHPSNDELCLNYTENVDVTDIVMNSTSETPGAAWKITAATDVTLTLVQESLYAAEGWSTPETGKYYYIYNGYWKNDVITENDTKLTVPEGGATNKAQVWQLTSDTNGKFSFHNLSTNNYIQSQSTNLGQYTTAATEVAFTVSATGSGLNKWYNIVDTNSDALKMERRIVVNNSLNNEVTQSYWRFKEVNPAGLDRPTTTYTLDELVGDTYDGIVIIRNVNDKYLGKVMAPRYDGRMELVDRATDLTDRANWDQIWLMERTNAGAPYTYAFRNLATGKYIQKDGPSVGESKYAFYVQGCTRDGAYEGAYNIAHENKFDGTHNAIHIQDEGNVIVYWGATASNNSDWYIEPCTDVKLEDVKAYYNEKNGYAEPVSGKLYKIVSRAYGTYLTELWGNNNLRSQENLDSPTQYWRITISNGKSTIQNVSSRNYIQGNPGTYNKYKLGTSQVLFEIEKTETKFEDYYTIQHPNSNTGLHSDASQYIVPWTDNTPGSHFFFQEVTMTKEEIAEAEKLYDEFKSFVTNKDVTGAAFKAFFSDDICTTLKSEYANMDVEDLKKAIATLPKLLQDVVLKVRNDSWADYEKDFRIAEYKAFSNADYWSRKLKTDPYGVINNPTGIVADAGDYVIILVDQAVPEGMKLQAEARVGYNHNRSPQQAVDLQQGYNIVYIDNPNSHIYIQYEPIHNTDDTNNDARNQTLLSERPVLKIHVEGGRVNGYFDINKHTDAQWVDMIEKNFFSDDIIDVLGNCSQLHAESRGIRNQNPTAIIPLIKEVDWLVGTQHNIMGLTAVPESLQNIPNAADAYENIYPSKINNRMVTITVDGGGMNATSYRIQFPVSALNYEARKYRGGELWGEAHEYGHNNQGAIKMFATTEVSNNFFSNMAVYLGGTCTSRGWNLQSMQPLMANGVRDWPHIVTSDIWLGTQMFYQLYLYYHAAGHNPLFYQTLFKSLRANPLNNPKGDENCSATGDYLHFYKLACDAAGEDLTEFFDYYGFFMPIDLYSADDYGMWYISCTQDEIDAAKAYVQGKNYPKANGNIMFIEDRAVESYKTYAPEGETVTGTTPKNPFDGHTLSACTTDFAGAQYSAFNGEVSHPDGLSYTFSDNTVTINTDVKNVTNAAGVKFYDAEGKLVYVASQTSIRIPANLQSTIDHSKTVLALTDGTTMPLYKSSEENVFTQTIHHSDGSQTTRYTKGNDDAMFNVERDGKNAVAMITGANVPESLVKVTNVAVNNNFYQLSLTDIADFRINTATAKSKSANSRATVAGNSELTAENITYTDRKLYAGWNTLCLPFAVTAADFGDGAKIEVLEKMEDNVLYFTQVDGVAAGQPCLVKVPADIDWTYNKANGNITVVGTPQINTSTTFYMNGSFTEELIGAGHYKMNTAGTEFGVTSDAGKIYPFRAYISTSKADAARRLNVSHIAGDATGIDTPILKDMEGAQLYDLQGRKVAEPKRGEIYILNGMKIIFGTK